MIVNKKLDRFKQWAGERMGGEIKTTTTDEFKQLEQEMEHRQQGMEKMQESMNGYVKAISKRSEIERKEKTLPISHLGGIMISFGGDLEHDSELGQSLTAFGRTQERLARTQESYISAATSSWLESLERSLVQMKEYQAARKKLEARRLAYDTSLAKMQKAKREDFRVEEELRSQQAKYEEAEADVERRMLDIKDSEPESVADLGAFLEAQLIYHDKCREALIQLQQDFPAPLQQTQSRGARPAPRSRSNTVRSFVSTQSQQDDSSIEPSRPAIRSIRTPSSRYNDLASAEHSELRVRPQVSRATTYDSTTQLRSEMSPLRNNRLSRVPSDTFAIQTSRAGLRRVNSYAEEGDVFGDGSTTYADSNADSYDDRPLSPAISHGSSMTNLSGSRKAPPPPPPSRASKPQPPPVPTKRSLLT